MKQSEKGQLFYELHQREGTFLIPNPWDVGSARLLASLGFEALATTSAGAAFSCGRADSEMERDVMLEHVRLLAAAVDIPLSADLENGYDASPEGVTETLRLAAEAGAVGGSIEDASGRSDHPIYDSGLAKERIAAAVELVRSLPFRFTLTARAENFLHGRPDLRDTIARLQAFQEAGADVLYAPGLSTEAEVQSVLAAVDRPVNFLATPDLSVATLNRLGVKRISVGSALARAAYGAFLRAAQEMKQHGTFTFQRDAIPFTSINAALRQGARGGIDLSSESPTTP